MDLWKQVKRNGSKSQRKSPDGWQTKQGNGVESIDVLSVLIIAHGVRNGKIHLG